MKRHVHVAVLALVAFAPVVAQTPKGWKMRVDRSTSASDPDAAGDIKFVTMGSGFHATNPQAAVYWNPANAATGTASSPRIVALPPALIATIAPRPAPEATPIR